MHCNIIFTCSDDVPELVKKITATEFMVARNKAIDLLNPNYKKWNDEFEKEYGKFDNYNIPKYNNFIRNKMDEILKDFNETNRKRVKLYANSECDIAGWFNYNDENIFIDIKLTY